MADRFHLFVYTAERVLVDQDVREVTAQGALGEIGVLPDHAALVTALEPGVLTYRAGGAVHRLRLAGGFAEVRNDKVIVLAENAERPDEIDRERAQRAKERAERRLGGREGADVDFARAQAALARALIRLQVANYPG